MAVGMIRVKRGFDLPISNGPRQEIDDGSAVRSVALVGNDYVGMKPSLAVEEGDHVKLGQVLFTDKRNPGVQYTSPGCGTVRAINRGAKRRFQSLVVELDGEDEEVFSSYDDASLDTLKRESVRENLIQSGLWTAFRKRPFTKVPAPESVPHSIFITAIDSNPLAPKPDVILEGRQREFVNGLRVIRHLTDGRLFLCKSLGAKIPGDDLDFVTAEEFAGPHPSGLVGTHIHFLDPVSENKSVWHVNYQDVVAIGHLFDTGRLLVDRVISVAGPSVQNPRLVRTRIGANVDELLRGNLVDGEHRAISGSVLSGRTAAGPLAFLGRYHNQVSVLAERRTREFLGWLLPGCNKFSIRPVYASALTRRGQELSFTTARGGSLRSLVPIGMYEQVMPLDILPTFLLRALLVGDTEQAQALGCLELDEEDLALCTFVCPSKLEYGPVLRMILEQIEKEG